MSLNCNLKVKRDLLKNDMNYISEWEMFEEFVFD